jgi:hypothetical protein
MALHTNAVQRKTGLTPNPYRKAALVGSGFPASYLPGFLFPLSLVTGRKSTDLLVSRHFSANAVRASSVCFDTVNASLPSSR